MARKKKETEFTKPKRCLHCGNQAPMEILGGYEDVDAVSDEDGDPLYAEGPCFDLLKCPACGKPELRTYHFHTSDHGERQYQVLYPAAPKGPLGLPLAIQ